MIVRYPRLQRDVAEHPTLLAERSAHHHPPNRLLSRFRARRVEFLRTLLDLALALLRDPAGNITLSIPVTVSEEGTSTGLGAIIVGALRQALVGAVTAPLKMLGAGFSALASAAGSNGAQSLPCAPGETQPAPEADETLDGLAKLLGERPELVIRLFGRSGKSDRDPVAQQILIERVQGDEGLPDLEDSGFFARRRVAGALADGKTEELDPEDQALLARYVGAIEVPAERLASLALARAEAARVVLVEGRGVDPERLDIAANPAEAGEPGVVIELEVR